jgi:hypothetical protein
VVTGATAVVTGATAVVTGATAVVTGATAVVTGDTALVAWASTPAVGAVFEVALCVSVDESSA